MAQTRTAIYRFVIGLLAITFICLMTLFFQLIADASCITVIFFRVTLELAIMLVLFPFIIANMVLLFPIGKRRVIHRVVYLSETPKSISINAGWPALYLKAFIASIGDRKGNARKVARELRDAGKEAITLANTSKKTVVLMSPLLNKPSVRAWLERNAFTKTQQFPWFINSLLWIFLGPAIASIALFTGNMYIGPWQTWTRP